MMNVEITPAMLATLEKLVEQHRDDTPADQEALCIKVGQDEPEIGAKLREMFTAAEAASANSAKVVDVDSAKSWSKRRLLPPDPGEELAKKVLEKKGAEAFFKNAEAQPRIDVKPSLNLS